MATTYTYSGQLVTSLEGSVTFSGDATGTQKGSGGGSVAFAASGGTAPTTSGFLKGTLTISAPGDILLAHATDPFQGFGDAVYASGFTVAGSKLKSLLIRNTGSSGSVVIIRAAANGLPIFQAAGDGIELAAGDVFLWHKTAGTAALTTGTNDALTLTPTGTATLEVTAVYGP